MSSKKKVNDVVQFLKNTSPSYAAVVIELREQLQAQAELVQEAYREGWSDGVSDGHPLSVMVTGARRWDESGAKASLKALQEENTSGKASV
jgi:hypothetical protein